MRNQKVNKMSVQNQERGNDMELSNQLNTQNIVNQMVNESVSPAKEKKTVRRKSEIEHQQDLIELVNIIYYEPRKYDVYNLAHELDFLKDVNCTDEEKRTPRRKTLRMIEDINKFCPCIKSLTNDINGHTYYYINENITEAYLDNCYKKNNKAPLLYLYLKALLIRPVSLNEIVSEVEFKIRKKDRSRAKRAIVNEMMNRILDTSFILDDIRGRNNRLMGNYKFFC